MCTRVICCADVSRNMFYCTAFICLFSYIDMFLEPFNVQCSCAVQMLLETFNVQCSYAVQMFLETFNVQCSYAVQMFLETFNVV